MASLGLDLHVFYRFALKLTFIIDCKLGGYLI